MGEPVHGQGGPAEVRAIKCLVWDLDNTIWNGILLEDAQVSLKESVPGILDTLDKRGILQDEPRSEAGNFGLPSVIANLSALDRWQWR